MNKQPFALRWSMPTPVFGISRDLPGHDFFDTEYEMEQAIFPLMQKKARDITRYKYSVILQQYIEMESTPHE